MAPRYDVVSGEHGDCYVADPMTGSSYRPEAETIANAHILAAAPALLAVCEALFVRLHREQGGQANSPWAAPLAHLRQVIAQARGA